jgi:hypothetical protein
MTNNIFMVRNVFYQHKDYSSFLGGKLTVFKLCNYEIMLTKVSRVILGLFQLIFLLVMLILLLVNFCRTIRFAYVYFIIYALVCCLWLV